MHSDVLVKAERAWAGMSSAPSSECSQARPSGANSENQRAKSRSTAGSAFSWITRLAGGWQVAAEVDFADLLSESAAQLQLHDSQGHISMKILTDSAARSSKAHGEPHDLWDAGRILGPGARVSFRLPIKARTTAPSRLLLLLAPIEPATITLSAQGRALAEQRIEPSDEWVWQPFQLPAGALVEEETLELKVTDADTALYHLWLLQPSQ